MDDIDRKQKRSPTENVQSGLRKDHPLSDHRAGEDASAPSCGGGWKNVAGEDASAPGGESIGAPNKKGEDGPVEPERCHREGFLQPSFIPSSKETGRVVTSVEPPEPHRGWHSRGYLPHWDHPGMMQGITFRLADALPQTVLNRWIHELASQTQTVRQAALAQRLSDYLDAGHGSCALRDPAMARVTEGALVHFDGERYRLLAWCVMPNHVHVLIETITGFPQAEVVQAWKSYLAHKLNRMLGRTGELWEREYHDRYIRNAEHYEAAVRYIEMNPVKAGLARFAHEWPYSSARWRIMRT